MPNLIAHVPFDTGGYRWVRIRNPGPFGDRSNSPEAKWYLEGSGYAQLRREFVENGSVHWNGYDFLANYEPQSKEPVLFRIFAELEPTQAAILEFANRYGDLAEPIMILNGPGRSLAHWRKSILKIRDAIATGDELVRRSVDDHELLGFARSLLNGLAVNVTLNPGGEGIGIVAMGTGLLDAIKFQLADAIAERKGYRKCDLCGRPFELRPQINRSDRVFCSDSCRVKSYQHRKKDALELRSKGWSMRRIAERTGSDLATVERWLGRPK